MTADMDCPYCGETVPIKVKLENQFFEDYLEVEGYSWQSEPIPEITVCYKVDLEALARNIDRLLHEEQDRKKQWDSHLNEAGKRQA